MIMLKYYFSWIINLVIYVVLFNENRTLYLLRLSVVRLRKKKSGGVILNIRSNQSKSNIIFISLLVRDKIIGYIQCIR